MHKVEDIYIIFRMAQAEAKNRGYRIPKNLSDHFQKMVKKNYSFLVEMTNMFNTKYHNIDPFDYFNCGFKLFKNFTYYNFLDEKVINLYIIRDKNAKRSDTLTKKSIVDSVRFMMSYLKNEKTKSNIVSPFIKYCNIYCEGKPAPIFHYINNKSISKHFLVWLIKSRYLQINDIDKNYIPFIIENYRDLVYDCNKIETFMKKILEKIT